MLVWSGLASLYTLAQAGPSAWTALTTASPLIAIGFSQTSYTYSPHIPVPHLPDPDSPPLHAFVRAPGCPARSPM